MGGEADPAGGTCEVPVSRLLLALPFIGLEQPAESAEFAHPDVAIGRTISAYMYRHELHHVRGCAGGEAGGGAAGGDAAAERLSRHARAAGC